MELAGADRLRRSIADLDNGRFAIREAASKTLSELGEKARPALEEVVKNSTSLELTNRAKKVLGEVTPITPEQLRQMHSAQLLEWIASDEAKKLLKQRAAGIKGPC